MATPIQPMPATLRLRGRPETLPVSLTFMPLFRNM
jgi:hypothetical protein